MVQTAGIVALGFTGGVSLAFVLASILLRAVVVKIERPGAGRRIVVRVRSRRTPR
jgi:hypothetical protein